MYDRIPKVTGKLTEKLWRVSFVWFISILLFLLYYYSHVLFSVFFLVFSSPCEFYFLSRRFQWILCLKKKQSLKHRPLWPESFKTNDFIVLVTSSGSGFFRHFDSETKFTASPCEHGPRLAALAWLQWEQGKPLQYTAIGNNRRRQILDYNVQKLQNFHSELLQSFPTQYWLLLISLPHFTREDY
jgi:hypothetical protein